MFASTQQSGMSGISGLFGAKPSQPAATSNPFGSLAPAPQQQQQQQPAPSSSLFGNLGQSGQQQQQQQQQQSSGGLFGALGQSTQQQQQQQQPGSLLQSTQQKPFGQSVGLPPLQGANSAMWQPNSSVAPREKSVPEQIKTVVNKWDISSPDCAFQFYFYNKVDESAVPLYRPGENEDPKAWDDALSKKPGPNYIPVLCTGFPQLGARIKNQQGRLADYNRRLHMINDCLSELLHQHETKHSIRAMDAKRKHIVLRQRCLTLATKVQILRNRGYALGGDEEDLKTKLQILEKGISDPGLGARGEEIWARMLTVQQRARILQNEVEKSGLDVPDMLDEETTQRAKKILEDYDRQLIHLKKELDTIQKEYVEWERDQPKSGPNKVNGR